MLVLAPLDYASTFLIVLEAVVVGRTVAILAIAITSLVRMRLEIKNYKWLLMKHFWRIAIMGILVITGLSISLYLSIISLKDAKNSTNVLASVNASRLHWLEFYVGFIPCLAIWIAYPPDDMFTEFNRYPEHVYRVSVL